MRSYQNILVGIDVHGPEWDKPYFVGDFFRMD